MHPTKLVNTLQVVIEELQLRQLQEFVGHLLEGNANVGQSTRAGFTEIAMKSNVGLTVLSRREEAAKVIAAFGLNQVLSHAAFAEMMADLASVNQTAGITGDVKRYSHFKTLHARIEAILKTLDGLATLLFEHRKAEDPKNSLHLELVDPDNNRVEVERLRKVLSSLEDLYADLIVAVADDVPVASREGLRIEYVESGSSILLAIVGTPAALALMGGAIKWIYGVMSTRKNEVFDRDIDSLAKGLEVMSLIDAKVSTKALSAEDGAALKGKVVSRLRKLVDEGLALAIEVREVAPTTKQLATGLRGRRIGPPTDTAG